MAVAEAPTLTTSAPAAAPPGPQEGAARRRVTMLDELIAGVRQRFGRRSWAEAGRSKALTALELAGLEGEREEVLAQVAAGQEADARSRAEAAVLLPIYLQAMAELRAHEAAVARARIALQDAENAAQLAWRKDSLLEQARLLVQLGVTPPDSGIPWSYYGPTPQQLDEDASRFTALATQAQANARGAHQ